MTRTLNEPSPLSQRWLTSDVRSRCPMGSEHVAGEKLDHGCAAQSTLVRTSLLARHSSQNSAVVPVGARSTIARCACEANVLEGVRAAPTSRNRVPIHGCLSVGHRDTTRETVCAPPRWCGVPQEVPVPFFDALFAGLVDGHQQESTHLHIGNGVIIELTPPQERP